MARFVIGVDRPRATLLPECLQHCVGENNPVRAVDVFVDALDHGTLMFSACSRWRVGVTAIHPSVLLKLYIYGDLNRVQSIRRLESETEAAVTPSKRGNGQCVARSLVCKGNYLPAGPLERIRCHTDVPLPWCAIAKNERGQVSATSLDFAVSSDLRTFPASSRTGASTTWRERGCLSMAR
jgi:hypothetical protein